MLEGRDGLLPSLASPAFLPQFPTGIVGATVWTLGVIRGLRLMMRVKSEAGAWCMARVQRPFATH